MTNEEKLRAALSELLLATGTIPFPTQKHYAAHERAQIVLKETDPPKPKHPAEVAFNEWYHGDEPPGLATEAERKRRESFLAGYKAGIESIAILALSQHAEIVNLNFIQKLADEVPTE